MGLIIEKQRTKEEDGNVVTKRGIRERVTRPQVKKYATERKEREKIGKGENKERNIKSEEKKYSEKTPSGSKTKDTTNKRTKGKTAITNAEGSGETTRREEKEEEEFKSNWIPEHEDLVTFVLVSGSHTPDEGHDDDDESTSSSSFSFFASSSSTSSVLGRFQEKKPVPRFPSSRPTSLETIIEDGPCPYSFQEAIMSSSLDSRAFYRDCRGSLESLLGRNRGTHRNLPRKTDGFGGDIVLGRKKILSDILAEEENSGEDFLSVPEEEEEDGEEEWRDFLEKTMEGVVDAAAVGRKGESIDGSFSFPGEFLLEGEELKSLMNDSPLPYSFTAQDEAGDGPLTQDCQPDEDVVDAVSDADEGLPEGAAETDDACEEKHSKGIPEEADDFVDYDPRDIIHPSKDSDDGVNEDHHHHHNYSDGVLRERPTAEGDTAEVLDTIGDKRCIPDNECSDVERRQHLHQHHLLDPDGTQITTSDRDRCPGEVDGQREGGGGLEVIADGDEGAADEGDEGATDEGDEGAADEVVLDEGGTNGCRDILKKEGVDVSRKEEGDVSRSEGADMSKEGEGGTDVTKKEEVSPKEVSFSVYIQLEALNEEVTIEEKRGEGKEEEGKEATTKDGDEGEKKEQNKATEERIMSEAITKEMDGTITITNDITLETTTNMRSEQNTNKQNERILKDRDKVKTEEWDVEMTDKPKEGTTKEREEARQEGGEGRLAPKYLREFVKAIQSLDSLNDQIVEFIFSGTDFDDENGSSPKQREALKSSMALMRRLLVDAQTKFRKMVEDNKQLASRIDGDLQTAHQEVNLLRLELADTNRRITQLHQAHNHDHNHQEAHTPPDSTTTTTTINGSNKYHSESSSNQLAEELSQLRLENEKLSARNRSLQSEVEELRRVKETIVEEDLQLKPRINEMTIELTHAKEALSALKADRKRLKAEKFDLLNQMKQLYATLEDKEKELRDFIRNYEQRMKESDESLRHLAAERDETEREKWNILKHARDESERVVKLSAQLGLKEATVKKLQEELEMVRKQLSSVGYYSDAESVRTNGLTTPTASTPACSPLPLSTPTPTPNGRGSSADSGVRLSSDRDSTASHDGGAGTPKESPSLSPLYATPVCLKREDQGGDNTPTSTPTSTAASVNSPAVGGLANSSASAGGLSRSAEQLCERLSEAAETSKVRGTNTLSRKSHKSGGTWGSISRVFARQKKRAALDASLYDGNASDKRASWSPSSSLCASPLTEESYSEKLRLLEEAQHIPLERWKAPTVLAWLEVTLGMPQYGAMCAENVRSGKVLLELSDSELEAGLGIAHPMHRKKLRLAIEELREPRLSRFPRISILGHTWVSSEWLPDLGLPQYCDAFANNLVDGRLLEALTKKELEKHLGVHRKFHQASIIHGVHLLRIVRFDRQVLAERRRQCEHIDADPVVWTNMRWVRWARSIDLAEYADNLKDSGVHGALVVLESSFTSDTMATALGIPQSKNIIRRHLATELEGLVNPARQQLDEQARYAKMERRRQEKLASGGSLGRSFSRSYGTGLEKGEKDKRRASLRGSLSRALGLRLREEAATGGNNGGESSSSGGQSPAVIARTNAHRAPRGRPRSTIMPSGVYVHHETHRRVKSIGDIETITVTPV